MKPNKRKKSQTIPANKQQYQLSSLSILLLAASKSTRKVSPAGKREKREGFIQLDAIPKDQPGTHMKS